MASIVYLLISPSGKIYVGHTSRPLAERWGQHVRASRKDKRHPLLDAIRCYGRDSFKVEAVLEFQSVAEALCAEKMVIAVLQTQDRSKGYNISEGGEKDFLAAREALRQKLADPDWRRGYLKRLSAAVKASPAHKKGGPALTERANDWRRANPRAAWKIRNRAVRCSVKSESAKRRAPPKLTPEVAEKISSGVKLGRQRLSKYQLARESLLRRRQARAVWSRRTSDQIADIAKKISSAAKSRHKNKTPERRAADEAQLAQARKSIDHDLRKRRQKEALEAYWTPARRSEKAEAMRKYRADLRHS